MQPRTNAANLFSFGSQVASDFLPHRLRCEYRDCPIGIDILRPRLGWITESIVGGFQQSAYQILVADSSRSLAQNEGTLWNTGKVNSDVSIQIAYSGLPLPSRLRCHWKVRVWNQAEEVSDWSEPAFWAMGLLNADDWKAQWITAHPSHSANVVFESDPITIPEECRHLARPAYFRKHFHVTRVPTRAMLYATALGVYELWINGKRVGDHLLAPEWTDYNKRVQYQTYDVTPLLCDGENVLGAVLGNGWYCGDWQFWESRLRPIYGDHPHILTQLELTDETAGATTIITDESWRQTTNGPLLFSGIFEGEIYDARREMKGWNEPEFDESYWMPARPSAPGMTKLVWQRSEPIRVTQEIHPVRVTEPSPGCFLFDLGQNLAGWCRILSEEPEGTVITMRFNEMLNADGSLYTENLHAGHLATGPRQVNRFVSNGTKQPYRPHFTYQGFRYVEVTGLTKPPGLDFLTAEVFHTSFSKAGSFECSNPLLTRLAENIQWSQRSNIMGIPTDCCQRDERCGYTGDMNFFMPTAVFNFDMAAFFSKWLVDLCDDSQLPDGHFADHAPTYGPGNGWNVGWSDAGIICPYRLHRTYGDTRIIRDHYPAMKRNIEAQIQTSNNDIRGPEIVGLGDWLNLGGGASKEVIGTAYFAFDMQLVAEMADIIGEEDDAAEYRRRAAAIRTAFQSVLIDESGRIFESSQTGYALAFCMGLVPEDRRSLVRDQFAGEVKRFHGHLATGFIGTPLLLQGLHLAGLDDLACTMLLQEAFPSWLYPVKCGATTIWERWDGWTEQNGFADSGMNSFNHYAFGSVGHFLYSVIGGIRECSPGFKEFEIRPVVGHGLSWAHVAYDSSYGKIESRWQIAEGKLTLGVIIPPNTRATISVPSVTDDVVVLTLSDRVSLPTFLRRENGRVVFAVLPGQHRFTTAATEQNPTATS